MNKKLNYLLIQNDNILVIFLCLQLKLRLFLNYRSAVALRKQQKKIFFWQSFNVKKACFFVLQF